VPTIGAAISRTSVDDLLFDRDTPGDPSDDGVLRVDDVDSNVVFTSLTLAKSKVLPSGTAAINYFGTATIYSDLASDTTSDFFELDAAGNTEGLPVSSTSANLGTYGELSIGMNYTKLLTPGQFGPARQMDASVRFDARFSGELESYGLTGQIRFQF